MKTSDTNSTRKAICSLFLGGALGAKFFNQEAALLVFATMDHCCVEVFSAGPSQFPAESGCPHCEFAESLRAGKSTQYKPVEDVDEADAIEFETHELGFVESESSFVALLDNSEAETEDDEVETSQSSAEGAPG